MLHLQKCPPRAQLAGDVMSARGAAARRGFDFCSLALITAHILPLVAENAREIAKIMRISACSECGLDGPTLLFRAISVSDTAEKQRSFAELPAACRVRRQSGRLQIGPRCSAIPHGRAGRPVASPAQPAGGDVAATAPWGDALHGPSLARAIQTAREKSRARRVPGPRGRFTRRASAWEFAERAALLERANRLLDVGGNHSFHRVVALGQGVGSRPM